MNNKRYRCLVSTADGWKEFRMLGESEMTIEWSPNEDGWIFYEPELSPGLTFTGEAYHFFYQHETSEDRCTPVEIMIEMRCEAGWKNIFAGTVSMEDGDWDRVNCRVQFTPQRESAAACFERNKNVPVDLMALVGSRVMVDLIGEDVEFETVEHIQVDGNESGDYWPGDFDPLSVGWRAFYSHIRATRSGRSRIYNTTTRWIRLTMTLPCDVFEPTDDWLLIIDNCLHPDPLERKKVYVKAPTLINCSRTRTIPETGVTITIKECEVVGRDGALGRIRNGMRFDQVLPALVSATCPGMTVKSDFFQVNPEVVSDTNYVTGNQSKVNHLVVFQNSDINYPEASSPATKSITTAEKFFEALRFMFNVRFSIDGNLFVVEHVSFFERELGLDLRQSKYKKYLTRAENYSYSKTDVPSQEEWKWNSGAMGADFVGTPIVYTNTCGSTSGATTYAIEAINTDVDFALDKGEDSKLANEGLTLVATRREALTNEYFILTENGILGEPIINNPLAISQLLRDYHRYDRPFPEGIMNQQETDFITVKPRKKGEPIVIPFCCGDEFRPEDRVRTPQGIGVVEKASFNFKTSTLSLDILY